jgi:hypothetical protein
MKTLAFMTALLITLFTLSYSQTKNDSSPKVSNRTIRKIECNIFKDESFDSTFIMNGNKIRLSCNTECQGDYSVPDTINESVVELFQNRLFRFKLKGSTIDTQFVVTKEIIKEIYKDRNVYIKSLLVYPRIESIDTLNKTILIQAAFMYPRGLGGTDFFEDVLFEITSKGKVVFKELIYYQQPGKN